MLFYTKLQCLMVYAYVFLTCFLMPTLGNPSQLTTSYQFWNWLNQKLPVMFGQSGGNLVFYWWILLVSLQTIAFALYLFYKTAACDLDKPYVSQEYLLFEEHTWSQHHRYENQCESFLNMEDCKPPTWIYVFRVLSIGYLGMFLLYLSINGLRNTYTHWFVENQYQPVWMNDWANALFAPIRVPPRLNGKRPDEHNWARNEQFAG